MATCLCDAFFSDVAAATVEVLEHAGCKVRFPEKQTCCGQPAFNSGDFHAARVVARHTAWVFSGEQPVVTPSGSCAAMHRHGLGVLFEGAELSGNLKSLSERTWELADFLVNQLGVTEWKGKMDRRQRIAIHDSCHTRGSGTSQAIRTLLGSIEGLEIVEFDQEEQCCGFGGTFSICFPHISREMGTLKLDHALAGGPEWLVSGDMSCLMHLKGLAEREERPLKIRHVAQVLRDAIA